LGLGRLRAAQLGSSRAEAKKAEKELNLQLEKQHWLKTKSTKPSDPNLKSTELRV